MISLLRAGLAVQEFLVRRDWKFCFIGGIANFRWGTPRLTNDLDLTLLTGFGSEAQYVTALLESFQSRIDAPESFAAANRVLLLQTGEGVAVDIALGAMPFEEASVARSSHAELAPGVALRTCSAEDLIVHKAFAARPQDWVDVEGVMLRQKGRLEWPQIWADLGELVALKEEPEILALLRRTIARAEGVIGEFPH